MRYHQLMSEDTKSSLSGRILDLLTPIASSGIEFVTVDQLIQKIKGVPTGMLVDREMLIDILDPEKFPLIKSIEGDNVYLKAQAAVRSVTGKQKKTEADKIKDTATKKAVKTVKSEL